MIKHNTTYQGLYAWAWVVVLGVLGVLMATRLTITERTETVTRTEDIAYNTTYVEDETLEYGKTAIRVAGYPGERTLTYKVTNRGSTEISRELVSSEVTREPTDKVVARGTKMVWHCHDTTSFDKNPYNDNYCEYSDGTGRYVPDSEAVGLDPTYKPGKSGAPYYNNF